MGLIRGQKKRCLNILNTQVQHFGTWMVKHFEHARVNLALPMEGLQGLGFEERYLREQWKDQIQSQSLPLPSKYHSANFDDDVCHTFLIMVSNGDQEKYGYSICIQPSLSHRISVHHSWDYSKAGKGHRIIFNSSSRRVPEPGGSTARTQGDIRSASTKDSKRHVNPSAKESGNSSSAQASSARSIP